MARVVVLGIGNTARGDDGAGRQAARLLRPLLPGKVEVLELDGEATAILAGLENADAAYLIDACVSGSGAPLGTLPPPGTLHRIDAAEGALPHSRSDISTHGFGLAGAVELARVLGKLPPRCIVYAIEAESFEPGAPLSAAVAAAAVLAAERIKTEIEAEEPCTTPP